MLLSPQSPSRADLHKWKVFLSLQNSKKCFSIISIILKATIVFPVPGRPRTNCFPTLCRLLAFSSCCLRVRRLKISQLRPTQAGLKSQHNNYKCLQEGGDVPGGEDAILWIQAGGIRLGFLPGNIILTTPVWSFVPFSCRIWGITVAGCPIHSPDSWCTWMR